MTVLTQLFRKVFRFLQQHYVKESTSRFYNPKSGEIDSRLIEKTAKHQLLNYELKHYLHLTDFQIKTLNRDDYLLACSKAGLIERHKIKVLAIAHETALARVVNAMFGKK